MTGAAVLFDFDGTLVRGDCAAAWLRTRLTDSTWRKLVAGLTWPFLRPGFAWWRSAWLPASFRHVESVRRERSHAAAQSPRTSVPSKSNRTVAPLMRTASPARRRDRARA